MSEYSEVFTPDHYNPSIQSHTDFRARKHQLEQELELLKIQEERHQYTAGASTQMPNYAVWRTEPVVSHTPAPPPSPRAHQGVQGGPPPASNPSVGARRSASPAPDYYGRNGRIGAQFRGFSLQQASDTSSPSVSSGQPGYVRLPDDAPPSSPQLPPPPVKRGWVQRFGRWLDGDSSENESQGTPSHTSAVAQDSHNSSVHTARKKAGYFQKGNSNGTPASSSSGKVPVQPERTWAESLYNFTVSEDPIQDVGQSMASLANSAANQIGRVSEIAVNLPSKKETIGYSIKASFILCLFMLISCLAGVVGGVMYKYIPEKMGHCLFLLVILTWSKWMRLRTPLFVFIGLITTYLCCNIKFDSYVEIHPSKLNNERVYQALDTCIREGSTSYGLMTPLYILSRFQFTCALNRNDHGCSHLVKEIKKFMEVANNCVFQVIRNKELFEPQDIRVPEIIGYGSVSETVLSFNDLFYVQHELTSEDKQNALLFLANRLHVGTWWHDKNRIDAIRKYSSKFTDESIRDFLLVIVHLTPLLSGNPIGYLASFVSGGYSLVNFVKDRYPEKFELLTWLHNQEDSSLRSDLNMIRNNRVYAEKVFLPPSVESHYQQARNQFQYDEREIRIFSSFLTKVRVPRPVPMGVNSDETPNYNDKLARCNLTGELQTINWNVLQCPGIGTLCRSVIEAVNESTNAYCPENCGRFYQKADAQALTAQCTDQLSVCRSDLSTCHDDVATQKQDHTTNLIRMRSSFDAEKIDLKTQLSRSEVMLKQCKEQICDVKECPVCDEDKSNLPLCTYPDNLPKEILDDVYSKQISFADSCENYFVKIKRQLTEQEKAIKKECDYSWIGELYDDTTEKIFLAFCSMFIGVSLLSLFLIVSCMKRTFFTSDKQPGATGQGANNGNVLSLLTSSISGFATPELSVTPNGTVRCGGVNSDLLTRVLRSTKKLDAGPTATASRGKRSGTPNYYN